MRMRVFCCLSYQIVVLVPWLVLFSVFFSLFSVLVLWRVPGFSVDLSRFVLFFLLLYRQQQTTTPARKTTAEMEIMSGKR